MAIRVSQMIGDKDENEELIYETMLRTRCAVPCIVQSYNSTNNTVECQPAIRESITLENGSTKFVNLPLLINVPVVFPHVGQHGIKFPIHQGDEVLVIFSDMSIDNFWEKGNVQNPIEQRRHDLSDGIAIPCTLSLPKQNATWKAGVLVEDKNVKFYYYKASNATSYSTLTVRQINSRLSTLENKVSDLETAVQNLTTAIQNLQNTFNNHKHTVTIGENVYQTSAPI